MNLSAFRDQLGRYRIVHKLGHGGRARVFAGHDPKLGRWVAIKVIAVDDASDVDTVQS